MKQAVDNHRLLAWAGACAAALETTRHVWKSFRGRTPRGFSRASFVLPAAAITGAFLVGVFFLSRKRTSAIGRTIH